MARRVEDRSGWIAVPVVPRLASASPARRAARPLSRRRSSGATPAINPVTARLLALQHAERRARVEARSLSPPVLEELERRIASELAAEAALERGRAETRAEIRAQIEAARSGRREPGQRFPALRPWWQRPLEMLGCGVLATFSPFILFFCLLTSIALA